MYTTLNNHSNLSVIVKRHGFLDIFRKSYTVDCMYFNQLGMAFLSKNKFNPESELLIKISIKDTGEEFVSGIVGIVLNTRKERSGNYRCDVEFYLQKNKKWKLRDDIYEFWKYTIQREQDFRLKRRV